MNIDPKNPKKPDRDRFVLSKGHTAPGLYSTLAVSYTHLDVYKRQEIYELSNELYAERLELVEERIEQIVREPAICLLYTSILSERSTQMRNRLTFANVIGVLLEKFLCRCV